MIPRIPQARVLFTVVCSGAALLWTCGLWPGGPEIEPRAQGQDKKVDIADPATILKAFVQEFVEITPGKNSFPEEFEMGTDAGLPNEKPATIIRLSHSFAIAKYEVPQNLYLVVMQENPSRWKGTRNAVEMNTWKEAVRFCEKVTLLLRERKLIGQDEVIRLPSEAEWEYCCRAGTKTKYSFGDEARRDGDLDAKASLLDSYGWHHGNAAGNDPPVGALKPNPWGLYDMHGYLWEFTQDGWSANQEGIPRDGSCRPNPETGTQRVIRGGSWKDRYDRLQSTSRRGMREDGRDDAVGFRCVKAIYR